MKSLKMILILATLLVASIISLKLRSQGNEDESKHEVKFANESHHVTNTTALVNSALKKHNYTDYIIEVIDNVDFINSIPKEKCVGKDCEKDGHQSSNVNILVGNYNINITNSNIKNVNSFNNRK